MNRKDIEDLYSDDEPKILFADGYDKAIAGVVWDGDVGKFRPPSGCVCAGPSKYIPCPTGMIPLSNFRPIRSLNWDALGLL